MTAQSEWTLCQHEVELDRLQAALSILTEIAKRLEGTLPSEQTRVRREIEFTTARMIRHEISIALLSSRLVVAG